MSEKIHDFSRFFEISFSRFPGQKPTLDENLKKLTLSKI